MDKSFHRLFKIKIKSAKKFKMSQLSKTPFK